MNEKILNGGKKKLLDAGVGDNDKKNKKLGHQIDNRKVLKTNWY